MKAWLCSSAIKESFRSKYPNFKHGAVIVNNNVVVARGVNVKKPLVPQADRLSVHAEVNTINKVKKENLIGATLYIARTKNGLLRNSKPCPACEIKIRKAGIKRVYYSIQPQEWGILELWI